MTTSTSAEGGASSGSSAVTKEYTDELIRRLTSQQAQLAVLKEAPIDAASDSDLRMRLLYTEYMHISTVLRKIAEQEDNDELKKYLVPEESKTN